MICYIILTFSAISDRNNVISPSEMYHDIFQEEKKYYSLEMIGINRMAEKFYTHTYLTLTLFVIFNIN